jgi:hypothetical protein
MARPSRGRPRSFRPSRSTRPASPR